MNEFFDLSEQEATPAPQERKEAPAWLAMLNPEQKQAVLATEGPLLVLSGAGTGKTKVLTSRLAHILQQRLARPWECLVVTFTNRAANEMKERAISLIGEDAAGVWLGTFHSVCVKILRKHPGLAGLRDNFTILGEDDQKRLVKRILEDEGIDDKKYPPQSLLDKIGRWKDKGLTPDKLHAGDVSEPVLLQVYRIYQRRLTELNCVDFGDILLHALNILLKNAEVLDQYQNRFRYIMVDEYQDTNVTQYLFLRLLSQKSRNLCVVGDDDQSIYSWRGAEIENILRFEKDFPDAKIIRLERNYRSTANILAAASRLISHNSGRLGKELVVAENSPAAAAENDKVRVVNVYNGAAEAGFVVEEIEDFQRKGFKYSEMAVLVRTAFQTREFEEKFIAEAIPYRVVGGLKFYDRLEIRDALAYLRIILSPGDDLAFERIINKPTRGIGERTIETFRHIAADLRVPMVEAARNALSHGLVKGKARDGLARLLENFDNWRRDLNALPASELLANVLEDSGYIEMLRADKSPDAPGRIDNLNELISVLGDEDKFPTLADFMEHVSLVMENDSSTDTNRVQLITLHSAKGLEFDIVFLPGWEEGLFPHQRALDEGGEDSLEEERRLAYVAITRAKRHLFILNAYSRRIYGSYQNNLPSRFIDELPKAHIEKIGERPEPVSAPGFSYSQEPECEQAESLSLIGAKVWHQNFGYGIIRKAEGEKLGIWFFQAGFKMAMKGYVKVMKDKK